MEKQTTMKKKYINIILTLLAVAVMPFYLYGQMIIPLLIVGVATAIVFEFICNRFAGKKKIENQDYSCIITALITTLLLPATAPWWIVVVSVFVALVIAKHPFGGTGFNIFNPAAAGLAFVAICWPEYVLRYPIPQAIKSVTDASMIQYVDSFSSILKGGGTPKTHYFTVLLGDFAGPMGATCILVLLTCMIYLLIRRVINIRVVSSTILVVAITALLFPRVQTNLVSSLVFEFTSGVLLFGTIFMASDPATMPKTKNGQVLYGLILGIFVMIFRHFGAMELEFVYAILIANIFAIPCDRYANALHNKMNAFMDSSKAKQKRENTSTEQEAMQPIEKPQPELSKARIVVVGEVDANEKVEEVVVLKETQPAKGNTNQAKKSKANAKAGKAGRK
ncbi:RnfABCDGE type electron transport complex subunit D [Paludicola sp. MB14-C6]|uniref:RnfABCDGE type electron transport complex subunit D n=1 Tax=Paludihabitans sp. MB14-C6 TaxID=3070656 RepID=UPI0027DC0D55|nr:RnfABCDGE type electron transport complex subunit D [Paludicola sp. MB14-C6]WMJ23804.1 RnfABCDGE type electron transport complex subunit D [Paludicola sp. MB14-C6]